MTYIARTLSEFEIIRMRSMENILFRMKDCLMWMILLLSHIDYAGLARDKRQER